MDTQCRKRSRKMRQSDVAVRIMVLRKAELRSGMAGWIYQGRLSDRIPDESHNQRKRWKRTKPCWRRNQSANRNRK